MKRVMIIIACVSAAFCADIDQPKAASMQTVPQEPQTVEISFIDPETKDVLATGIYPSETINQMDFFKYQMGFISHIPVPEKETQEEKTVKTVVTTSIDKEIFDKLINLNPAEPLPQDLDFSSSAELIHAINTLQFQKFETPTFKTNIAKRIATDLNNNIEEYAKNFKTILQYKNLFNAFFTNNELSNALDSLQAETHLFSDIIKKDTYIIIPSIPACLSFDGNHVFEGIKNVKGQVILLKKNISTGEVVQHTVMPVHPDDQIMRLAATDKYVAVQLLTGNVIIVDQQSLNTKHTFNSTLTSDKEQVQYHKLTVNKSQNNSHDKLTHIIYAYHTFFSFSSGGKYLITRNYHVRPIYENKKIVRLGGSNYDPVPLNIINVETGAAYSFWESPKRESIVDRKGNQIVINPIFDEKSEKMYFIAVEEDKTKNKSYAYTYTLSSYDLDSQTRESLKTLDPNPDSVNCNPYTLLYKQGDSLWIRFDRGTNELSKCFTFNTKSGSFESKGDISYFKFFYLSEQTIAIASNKDFTFNKNPNAGYRETVERKEPDAICLCNPQKIEDLLNPTQGKIVFEKNGANFKPHMISWDKRTFSFADESEKKVYVFTQSRIPFEIMLGILCFQKIDDLKTLGLIRTALLPALKSLPEDVGQTINRYFIGILKEKSQLMVAAKKPTPSATTAEARNDEIIPQKSGSNSDIFVFDYKRDSREIEQLIKDEWKLLGHKEINFQFYIVIVLKNLTPYEDQSLEGQLKIAVARKDEKFVGFVSYFVKKDGTGHISLLAIRPEFRGQGYAQKLIDYAIDQMAAEGVSAVTISTRIENVRAQKIYLKKGFQETGRDDFNVDYTYPMNII